MKRHGTDVTNGTDGGKETPILFSGAMVRAILEGRKTQTRRVITRQPTSVEYHLHGRESDRLKGLPTMRDDTGMGWAMCGPFRCPFIAKGMYASKGGRLANSRIDDTTERKSLLWVKETWRTRREWDSLAPSKLPLELETEREENWQWAREQYVHYEVAPDLNGTLHGKIRQSIFMRRWMSRITLEITGIRVERLQELSEADAIAEGIEARVHHEAAAWNKWKESYDYPWYRKDLDALGQRTTCPITSYKGLWNSINAERGYGWDSNPYVWVIEFKRV